MRQSHDLIGRQFGEGVVLEKVSKPAHLKRAGRYWRVLCKCGREVVVDTTTLVRRWSNCGCIKQEDLTGKRFHKGFVISLEGCDQKGHRIWQLQCDCGNQYNARTESLNSGNTKSCGCLPLRLGKEHPHYKGHGDLSGDYWSKLQRGAQSRNIQFDISIETAWQLYLDQEKKCALTGWAIELSDSNKKEQTASLDRKDSNGNYTHDNIQWVHKDVNRIKQHYSQAYLFDICEAIIQNRKEGNN